MAENNCFWCKVASLCIVGVMCGILSIVSLNVDYQWLLTQEHIRFRSGFPSQANWITSPYGTLNCYLFNVTNAKAFLNGEDNKLKLQEVGPITYRIEGRNDILGQTDTTLTYKKIRYHKAQFDPKASCSPDILNQTIILPNFVLMGAAAKLHDWFSFARTAFNAITINESVFLNRTVYYFLWDFRTPALSLLSNYVPNIEANCGMLYNALQQREEIYNVNIGVRHGIKDFFRVNYLNNKTFFAEQTPRLKFVQNKNLGVYCPIDVLNSLDNSLFPPLINQEMEFKIIAGESCRTHQLKYNSTTERLGFNGYRYKIVDTTKIPNCLDNAMGIKLPKGMFDVTSCLFNNVPSAFSAPHFYGSNYNWNAHYEGLSPNTEDHETSIVIEPITGIPIEVKYRFQSNIPMPDMTGYSSELTRFSHMIVPTFWYEYDLDELPTVILLLMKFNVFLIPVIQPILIGIFAIISICCMFKIYLILKGVQLKSIYLRCLSYKKTYRNLSFIRKLRKPSTDS